ncbi:bifunctional apoptosis regulator-like isoform X4 [Ctenopharyngodon idella]|uniref:bifunctional apoptosis regulator-like isoform X4 n=1 Tax=Ctenopharyngodon idella TaxID=7959 RepID=UPI0022319FD1|nr:bifunctional apoptosis regulator-like isoform X4 [Ctenopharyngodon idella]
MDVQIAIESDFSDSEESTADLLEPDFTCHCCYEVLVDPTTLTCGHSFCRHCLATWWASALPSVRTDCPECRAIWQGFPEVNILLRDAVVKLFPADVSRRKQAVLSDPWLCRVLQAFQQHGKRPVRHAAPQPVNQNLPQINLREIRDGIVAALICLTMIVLVYRTFTADPSHETLLSKPLNRWSVTDVTLWVEHLGVWTNQYKETFSREQIDGRSLSALSDEDLSAAPFMIENQSHRRIILEELHRLKETGVTRPQTLWEYKEVNPGMTLFLLVSLRNFPRLTLLYLYLFDYDDAFLPFIQTVCPSDKPLDWQQWAEFLLIYFLLPYQLLSVFSWHSLGVDYWTAGVVTFHTALLTKLDVCFYWTLCGREMRTLLKTVWLQVTEVALTSSLYVLLWPLLPLFIINIEIYSRLYFSCFITAELVKKTLQTVRLLRP